MNKIEVAVLQEPSNTNISGFLARLTQRGHEISDMNDLLELWEKPVSSKLRNSLASLHHGTIKRFDLYTVAVVGASRRFLAQIRTHQHADFVSGSLQYSDWSDINRASDWEKMFVVPYKFIEEPTAANVYLRECASAYNTYQTLARVDNDAAGFIMPNGLRNVLIIQANVQQWQYMIKLRACNRNSLETQYVMLRIWEELLKTEYGEDFFNPEHTGADCSTSSCHEGKFCCQAPWDKGEYPGVLLRTYFPLLYKEDQ